MKVFGDIFEEVPPLAVNNVQGGKVSGLGVGLDGQPPVRKRRMFLRDVLKQRGISNGDSKSIK